jgi:hypothetical protein
MLMNARKELLVSVRAAAVRIRGVDMTANVRKDICI